MISGVWTILVACPMNPLPARALIKQMAGHLGSPKEHPAEIGTPSLKQIQPSTSLPTLVHEYVALKIDWELTSFKRSMVEGHSST
jgi:hypothetical protein